MIRAAITTYLRRLALWHRRRRVERETSSDITRLVRAHLAAERRAVPRKHTT